MIKNTSSNSLSCSTARNLSENVPKTKSTNSTNRPPLADRTNRDKVEGGKSKGDSKTSKTSNNKGVDKATKQNDDLTFLEDLPTPEEAIQAFRNGDKELFQETLEGLYQNAEYVKIQLSEDDNNKSDLQTILDAVASDMAILKKFLSEVPSVEKQEVTPKWVDIDAGDASDPQSVVDYVNVIYDYMLEKEKENLVSINYLTHQSDINEKMRGILVDWLVEVHRMFKLLPETLFLTVYIIDKFLGVENIPREQLQLVGITAMLISSKYEEIYAPECNDFVYISDGAYTKRQILDMENVILNRLAFKLTTPLALQFLRRYSKAAGSDYNVHSLCKYIIETMLLDVNIHTYPPSIIAATAVFIARKMSGNKELWNATLEKYTTYSEKEIRGCVEFVNGRLKATRGSSLKAIEKKYSLAKFGQVTGIALVDV